jgi:twin arginine-targeting protein translocase tatC
MTQPRRAQNNQLPTFLDHARELQWRLMVVVGFFLLAGALAYPFFNDIVRILLRPLGKAHELVYLTPGGAFAFVVQTCLYVGLIGAFPAIIYHLYRFIQPAVGKASYKRVVGYTAASVLLAIAGVLFGYFVTLPAALQFLTGMNLDHINPMLTVESYISFVMAYLLIGALLFQVPLFMLMINFVRPFPPGGLMKGQKVVLVGAFVIAAVVSPTADPTNQVLLALPMILMYQVGVVWVYWVNRRARLAGRAQPVYRGARQEARDARDEDMSEITAIAQSRAVATRPRMRAIPSIGKATVVGGTMIRPRQGGVMRAKKLASQSIKRRSIGGSFEGAKKAIKSTSPARALTQVAQRQPVDGMRNYRKKMAKQSPAKEGQKRRHGGVISGVVTPKYQPNRSNLNSVHDLQPAPGRRGRSLDGF